MRCRLCGHPYEPWDPTSIVPCRNCGAENKPPHIELVPDSEEVTPNRPTRDADSPHGGEHRRPEV